MRVLYVSKALAVAAYRDKLRELGRLVCVRGVIPASWGRQGVEPLEQGTGLDLRLHPVRFAGWNHLHLYRQPEAVFEDGPYDLVHLDEEPYSLVTYQLIRHCRAKGLPAVFFTWQTLDNFLPPPFASVQHRVFRYAAGAVAGTARAAAWLRRQGYQGPVATIPQFGVSLDRFRPDPGARALTRDLLGWADQRLVAGYAGRLVGPKRVDLLIAAAARLPALHVIVLGDGPQRWRLERQAHRAGVRERVRFVGRVRSTEVPAWLNALDLLVLPSGRSRRWEEQFGRVAVEAMACGVPVVGSAAGAIPAVIGEAGLMFPPGDLDALAGLLAKLGGDPSLRRALAAKGRARVEEHFSQERIAVATARFYQAVLRGPGAE